MDFLSLKLYLPTILDFSDRSDRSDHTDFSRFFRQEFWQIFQNSYFPSPPNKPHPTSLPLPDPPQTIRGHDGANSTFPQHGPFKQPRKCCSHVGCFGAGWCRDLPNQKAPSILPHRIEDNTNAEFYTTQHDTNTSTNQHHPQSTILTQASSPHVTG